MAFPKQETKTWFTLQNVCMSTQRETAMVSDFKE